MASFMTLHKTSDQYIRDKSLPTPDVAAVGASLLAHRLTTYQNLGVGCCLQPAGQGSHCWTLASPSSSKMRLTAAGLASLLLLLLWLLLPHKHCR